MSDFAKKQPFPSTFAVAIACCMVAYETVENSSGIPELTKLFSGYDVSYENHPPVSWGIILMVNKQNFQMEGQQRVQQFLKQLIPFESFLKLCQEVAKQI